VRAGGLLAADASTSASTTAHAPGYIGRDLELQTDAPLKR
jgi:hypothetical protein